MTTTQQASLSVHIREAFDDECRRGRNEYLQDAEDWVGFARQSQRLAWISLFFCFLNLVVGTIAMTGHAVTAPLSYVSAGFCLTFTIMHRGEIRKAKRKVCHFEQLANVWGAEVDKEHN